MRRRLGVISLAWAASLLATAGGVAVAGAATATHLTAAGWQALAVTNANDFFPTATTCSHLGAGSTDAQVHGIVGICNDEADFIDWTARQRSQCASAASLSACGSDIAGGDTDLNAGAAWTHWFTGQLAAGGCRSFFSLTGQLFTRLAAIGAPFAADLRTHRSAAQIEAAAKQYLKQFSALEQQSSASTGAVTRDGAACNPAA